MTTITMNKLAIPAILTATIMVAGMFAFMPVEQASTVHTTVQDNTAEVNIVDVAATTLDTDTVELSITGNGGDFCINGVYLTSTDASIANTDTLDLVDISINDVIFLDEGGATPANLNLFTADADSDDIQLSLYAKLAGGNNDFPAFSNGVLCGDDNDVVDIILDSTTGNLDDVDVSARIIVTSAPTQVPTAAFDLTLD